MSVQMAASWFNFGGLRKAVGVSGGNIPLEIMIEEGQVVDFPRLMPMDARHQSALNGVRNWGSIADVEEMLATMAAARNGTELLWRKDFKLRTSLHYASRRGHLDLVKALVEAARLQLSSGQFNGFLNAKDYRQQTALYKACEMGHASVVEHLVVAGADLSVDPEIGIPVLLVAADREHVAVVNTLLDLCGDALQERDMYERTLLHVAARQGLGNVVKRLHEDFAERVNVNAEARGCVTALHLAVQCGHLEVVKLLLGWSGIHLEARNEENSTALHMAADGGHAQILQLLVAARVWEGSINAENCVGRTPLHYACRRGDADVVRTLLCVEGIDVNVQDCVRAFTPLHLAAGRGHWEAVKLLLENKSCPPDAECKIGPPPDWVKEDELRRKVELIKVLPGLRLVDSLDSLWTEEVDWLERFKGEHHAFASSKEKSISIALYRIGHEITSLGKASWTQYSVFCYRQESTALHLAAQNGHLEVVNELLAYPTTNMNATDIGGRTPLHFAAAKGYLDVVKALIAKPGIHLNAVTVGGPGMLYPFETPLHMAVHMERLEIVTELCAQPRVRGNKKNWQNKTPLDLAWEKPEDSTADEIRELLMKHKDVEKYVENLFKDRDLFQNAANALLVGGTMIASITFTGILQPPMALQLGQSSSQAPEAGMDQSNYQAPAAGEDPFAGSLARVFLISNSLSFAFASLTVSSAIHMLLPIVRFKQEPFIADGVLKIRRRVAFTSFLFTIAIIFVLVAYFQAGYSLMSSRVQERHIAMLISAIAIFLIPIMLSLVKDYIYFLHENIVEFWLSDSLRTLSETLHYQSPFLRPLFYHLIFLVSLVGAVLCMYYFFQW